jgi:hypothetical protein
LEFILVTISPLEDGWLEARDVQQFKTIRRSARAHDSSDVTVRCFSGWIHRAFELETVAPSIHYLQQLQRQRRRQAAAAIVRTARSSTRYRQQENADWAIQAVLERPNASL